MYTYINISVYNLPTNVCVCVSYEHLYPIEWYFHEMDPKFSWGMHQPSQVLPHPHLLHRPTLVPPFPFRKKYKSQVTKEMIFGTEEATSRG